MALATLQLFYTYGIALRAYTGTICSTLRLGGFPSYNRALEPFGLDTFLNI